MGYEPTMPSWSIPLRAHPFPHLSGTGLERSSGEEGSGRGQHAKEQKGTHGCVIRRIRPRDVSVFGLAAELWLVPSCVSGRNVMQKVPYVHVRITLRRRPRTNARSEGHERAPLHPHNQTSNRDHEGPVLLAHCHWRLSAHGSARYSSRIRLRRPAIGCCSDRGKATRTRHISVVICINTTVPRCIATGKNKKEEEQQPKR